MRHWILVLAALCVAANAKAQNTGRVTGTVTAAEDGRPLGGASVNLLGTNRNTFTNGLAVTSDPGWIWFHGTMHISTVTAPR